MSNDFRSLLSTFEAATGSKPMPKKPALRGEKTKKTLLELTTQLWNYSQIRQSAVAKPAIGTAAKVHVAVCLCIVDALPHERIWEYWCSQSNARISAELYIHAKHPKAIRSDFARSRLLQVTHNPSWNDVRVVHAMMSLIEEALKNPSVTHIIFGTESCLPICPLNEVELTLGRSYVQYFDKDHCNRFDEREVWDVVKKYVPLQAIHKALPGWCCLCRPHAQSVFNMAIDHLEGCQLYTAFNDCWAPEEAFFPTALALLGLLSETDNKSLTYAEWDDQSRNHQDRAHPRIWDELFNKKLVQQLRHEHGCIILRKMKRELPLRTWLGVVETRVMSEAKSGTKRTAQDGDSFATNAPLSLKPRI